MKPNIKFTYKKNIKPLDTEYDPSKEGINLIYIGRYYPYLLDIKLKDQCEDVYINVSANNSWDTLYYRYNTNGTTTVPFEMGTTEGIEFLTYGDYIPDGEESHQLDVNSTSQEYILNITLKELIDKINLILML